ncbi:hypothetical protein WICPIJ_002531 [Wickerhamomyces pijperi]|uniref:Uncharacterized protein n=1 Tax=Wickerhamomyces pijperi TaxID=599730 RepID=A0A9P8Q8T0_WICPI|nr:hypothetical protein WICPIJ_002531 [Wickerhamomyces pijperi]
MASEGEGPLYGSRFEFAPAVHKVQRESLGLAPTGSNNNNTITTSFPENLPFFVYQDLFQHSIPAKLFRPINDYEDADLAKEEEQYLDSLFNDVKYLLTSKYIQKMSKTFKDHKCYDSYDSMKPTFIELAIFGEHAVTQGHKEVIKTGRRRTDEEKIEELELFETYFKPFFEELVESSKILKGFKPPVRYNCLIFCGSDCNFVVWGTLWWDMRRSSKGSSVVVLLVVTFGLSDKCGGFVVEELFARVLVHRFESSNNGNSSTLALHLD